MIAFSPTGSQIIGTLERLSGRAEIVANTFERKDGALDFSYEGSTEIFYDDQETVTDENGKRLFLAEDGTEWPEDKIELREEEVE